METEVQKILHDSVGYYFAQDREIEFETLLVGWGVCGRGSGFCSIPQV